MILPQYMVWVGWVFVYDLILFFLHLLILMYIIMYIIVEWVTQWGGGGELFFFLGFHQSQ